MHAPYRLGTALDLVAGVLADGGGELVERFVQHLREGVRGCVGGRAGLEGWATS